MPYDDYLKQKTMKLSISIKNLIITVICYLYVLLFVYAAVSKLLDFENFKVQLGQSPLLSAYAGWVSWGVIITELVISLLLVLNKTRLLGLYLSFTLMVMFTTYIYIILNYSSFIPCSCGGVLEEMSWTQHMIFNFIFILLGGISIYLKSCESSIYQTKNTCIKPFTLIVFCLAIGGVSITLLYSLSEKSIQYTNKFIRRFPQHFAEEKKRIDLKYNSYYFAGLEGDIIYLGNATAPFQIRKVDTALHKSEVIHLEFDNKNLAFRNPRTKVKGNYFYVFEGSIPYVFQGKIQNWSAALKINSGYYFSQLVPIDSTNTALRYIAPISGENLIGISNLKDTLDIKVGYHILQKQIDGIFGTDGSLHYNQKLNLLCYVHRYRNEFTVFKPDFRLLYRGKTIDTINQAVIKLIDVKSQQIKTFAEPPLIVNKMSETDGNFLYINSTLRGQYESAINWKTASIIDVYDLVNNRYVASFYIYHLHKDKMRSFIIKDGFVYALIGDHLVSYKLRNDILKKYQ